MAAGQASIIKIQIAGMLGKQGLFKRDDAILQRVIDVMASEIKITHRVSAQRSPGTYA